MNKNECVRMKLLSLLNIFNIYAGMNRTTSVEKLDVLVGTLLCNIVAEVAVRNKENVLIVKIVYDLTADELVTHTSQIVLSSAVVLMYATTV